MYVSRELARQLREDPVSAAQIKEHIPPDELLELMGLTLSHLLDHMRKQEADGQGKLTG
jgi:hypothetical protein